VSIGFDISCSMLEISKRLAITLLMCL